MMHSFINEIQAVKFVYKLNPKNILISWNILLNMIKSQSNHMLIYIYNIISAST